MRTSRWSRVLVLCSILAVSRLARADQAAPLVDPSTGTSFDPTQTVDGVTYKCLGVGVRKVLWFKAYAAVFCVQGAGFPAATTSYVQAKRASAGNDLADQLSDDPEFFRTVVQRSAGKLVVMKLVRDISASRMASAFKDKLSPVLPPAKVQRLIDTIPGDAKDGEVVKIYSSGGKLTIDIAGNKKVIDDAEIAQKIWYAWLGPDGASPTLKHSIAEHAASGG